MRVRTDIPVGVVVDDDAGVRAALQAALEVRGVPTSAFETAEQAREWLRAHEPGLALVDLQLGAGEDGRSLLRYLRAAFPQTPVIVVTGDSRPESCADLMSLGAFYYLVKPYRLAALRQAVDRALHHRRMALRVPLEQGGTELLFSFLQPSELLRMAQSDAPLLLCGEAGTGKEILARAIHTRGPRRGRAFAAFNCGAVPVSFQEQELFGPSGALVRAEQGTLYLDEVQALSLHLQHRLTAALDAAQAHKPLRVIAALQHGLETVLRRGLLFKPLGERLSALRIDLPALRQRRSEVLPLARALLEDYCREEGRPAVPELDGEVLVLLKEHPLLDNVRGLRVALEHALAQCGAGPVRVAHLPQPFVLEARKRLAVASENEHELCERLKELLRKHNGSNRRVAAEMRIDPATVWRLKKRFNLDSHGNAHDSPNAAVDG